MAVRPPRTVEPRIVDTVEVDPDRFPGPLDAVEDDVEAVLELVALVETGLHGLTAVLPDRAGRTGNRGGWPLAESTASVRRWPSRAGRGRDHERRRPIDTSTHPDHRRRLLAVRAVHSGVFWVELLAIGWLVVTSMRGRRDRSVAVAAALVAAEGVVWIGNGRVCPLTPLAERYGALSGSVSDIWLPKVVARTIPQWSIPLVAMAAVLHVRGSWLDARRDLMARRAG